MPETKYVSKELFTCALFCLLAVMGVAPQNVGAQDSRFSPEEQQIPGPDCLSLQRVGDNDFKLCTLEDHANWLADVRHWREERKIRVGYTGARYALDSLKWTQSSFIQPQMMVEDRYFYDPVLHRYTVDKYLNDLEKRFGGIDAVLIWPTYPNMGIDNRNQHDLIRAMPGGISGVREMISDFHRRGVRVLFPMMMWDQGTRDPGKPWPDAIANLMAEIGADGINGDTQHGVPRIYSEAADHIGHPLAFEPEEGPDDEALSYNLLTWGQYKYPFAPQVDRYKWLEPRHMVNISDRWKKNKIDNLQFAFFNGVGWESWENIWGIWNGIPARDSEATRRMATLERGIASFLISQEWEPFFPMLQFGVFASRWPAHSQTVWTVVNRNEYDVSGPQIELPTIEGTRYFDLYHGVEITPQRGDGKDILSFDIEAKGFAALFAAKTAPDNSIQALLKKMKAMTAKPLSSFSSEWSTLPQQIVPIPKTKVPDGEPQGMVKIPSGSFEFRVHGIEIEGRNDIGVDVQYPWENAARRFHEHVLTIAPFWMDRFPVTNAEFKKFLDSTNYHPQDDLNFLRDWNNGIFPEGWGHKPVTWVSLEDARAFASWAGKRLPHEWEWQFAAQGVDGRVYPWGNTPRETAIPIPEKSRMMRGPDDVDAHPSGASPFGVMDMVGNVWQWTDEFTDEHTRSGILRGGSYYQPQGSLWYFPQAYRNDEHGKLLLMAPSKDRAGTLGFRCVQDAE